MIFSLNFFFNSIQFIYIIFLIGATFIPKFNLLLLKRFTLVISYIFLLLIIFLGLGVSNISLMEAPAIENVF